MVISAWFEPPSVHTGGSPAKHRRGEPTESDIERLLLQLIIYKEAESKHELESQKGFQLAV